jgi:hypothetical protein
VKHLGLGSSVLFGLLIEILSFDALRIVAPSEVGSVFRKFFGVVYLVI